MHELTNELAAYTSTDRVGLHYAQTLRSGNISQEQHIDTVYKYYITAWKKPQVQLYMAVLKR